MHARGKAMLTLALLTACARNGPAIGGDGIFLPFLDAPAPGQPLTSSPTLMMSFGGAAHRAVMDTGSTGIVVSAQHIPDWESLPTLGSTELTYSSSGRIMRGRWVVTPVSVTGANGAAFTTPPIAVLAVTAIDCLPRARDCEPEAAPGHVAMLGIGFARQGDHQEASGPDHNPFLAITPASATRRGYVVTREGVRVGLGGSGRHADFVTVPLERSARFNDWSAPLACIAVAGRAPACGTVLMDTGVPGAFLTVPADRVAGLSAAHDDGGGRLREGTRVEVQLGRAAIAGVGYTFTVGDASEPMTPRNVTLVHPGERPTFINTSFHFLNGFDYLYDAERGVVGYRPHPLPR